MAKSKNDQQEKTDKQEQAAATAAAGAEAPARSKKTLSDHAKAAYELFVDRLDAAEAEFPAWDDLSSNERVGFLSGAQHVTEGNEPRTDYERVVAEVMEVANA